MQTSVKSSTVRLYLVPLLDRYGLILFHLVMIIRVEILDKKTNQTITVEKSGSNRVRTLFSFMRATRKYANENHRVVKVSSDDQTILAEFAGMHPNMQIELLDGKSDVV
ncbi:MAG: hypothetical protein ABSE82_11135 [Nitrososphaerales archaeon]